MEWLSPFIVYRVGPDGALEEVYHAADLKQAKYWLTYIAQPGDVLCKTPAHPNYSDTTRAPVYWSHKEQSGKPARNEGQWRAYAESQNWRQFPAKQTCSGGD